MSPSAALPLAGLRIVVTRPAAQADALCEAIAARGGVPVRFPVMAIEGLADTSALRELAGRLEDYDVVFFVSPNAVRHALEVILAQRPWPPQLAVATVGKGSERALASHGLTTVIAPAEGYDSEAVLALPAFAPSAIDGKRVLVLRGDGGRELFGDTLRARGAQVDYLSCYRRTLPLVEPAVLRELAERGEIDALTLSSTEGVRNLLGLLGGTLPAAVAALPLFASHERIAAAARQAGFADVHPCAPGDDGLLGALERHFTVN
ncbi:uroporphyrinogen-III synthase [Pseudothauera lacus]|uniref:Uroporphyrinogen-III synthase n=1 Tax=Pseudothauera lacus TaxID=2136175 RepID=A0A2T4IHF0_9RHOO|nr:uroporphyrinogen-III synthase [Pseudothauera lacus]PTD97199.1 uroporphyrinogen III synthase [Pseudothauera lacus]